MDDQRNADCSAALEELYGFLDGELTAARRADIRHHLDHCSDCVETFEFETELRLVISSRCKGDVVPDRLRRRVVEAIAALDDERPGS
ncbi:MAG: mycothiol system anti-sigma-R factor [Actinomycetota bacterium]|nr:mycothiol system anti-sigma-R factor [Acidimicrobiia bacterium]MDQ3145594.1 mycothiol system anti-sigma-R factor [Actinomycetota bacterium]